MKLKRISIIGRPNVGKSTLFNVITGFRKAITSKTPGTTRDRIEAVVKTGQKQFLLVDTGGFDEGNSRMKSLVREQTLKAIDDSDILIFLIDGRDGLLPLDRELADLIRKSGKPIVPVVNKSDLKISNLIKNEFYNIGFDDFLFLSAEHRDGIYELIDRIGELLEEHAEPVSDLPSAVKMSFVGRPNVGKSSLTNRLLGWERVIVSEIPGTTIDNIDVHASFGKKDFIIVDTPGIRKRMRISTDLEKESSLTAIKSIRRSDIALLVIDASEGITDQDLKIANLIHDEGRGFIVLCNKWDLVANRDVAADEYKKEIKFRLGNLDYAVILTVSAMTGKGTEKIFSEVHALAQRMKTEFSTPELNAILKKVGIEHPHPMATGKAVKLKYIHQLPANSPIFQIFSNQPAEIEKNYVRYIEKKLRNAYNLKGVPLKFKFRKGDNPFIRH